MSEHLGNQQNYLCPKCKKGDRLSIEIKVWATLVPDGSDIDGQDHEWDDDTSPAMCHCGWSGLVKDFIELPDGDGDIVVCADCDTEWSENQCDEVEDVSQRFMTGDTYTDFQCPSCGALCFPIEKD